MFNISVIPIISLAVEDCGLSNLRTKECSNSKARVVKS